MQPQMKSIDIDVQVNAAIETRRRSFGETPNDILRRALIEGEPALPKAPDVELPPQTPGERVTGRWTVELLGNRIPATNLKGAYRLLLLLLRDHDRDFLNRFSKEQARSRRYVARSPADLYISSPKLAKQHAKPLADGWYFDTNLSTDQVARRIRIAARLCNLRYGKDVRLLNNLEEI